MKKLIFFLSLFVSFAAIGQQTDASLTTQVENIRNQTTPGSVTKTMIADMFQALVNSKTNIIYGVNASGTDTYSATVSVTVVAYVSGQHFHVKFANTNTGAATINFNSLGAKSIVKNVSTALASGDIPANRFLELVYDGTNFQIIGPVGVTGGTVTTVGTGTISNGVSASVTNPTTTPAINISLGDITPNSVSAVGTVTGSNLSGTNTGDQTLNSLLPSQTGNSGEFLTTDGTNASWAATGIADGDKGDITVSSSGSTWTIDNLVVTPAKMSAFSSSDLAGKLTDEAGSSGGFTRSSYVDDADALKANKYLTHNIQTSGTYTLVLTDSDTKGVLLRSVSAQTLTVPPHSSVAFPEGTMIIVIQDSTGLSTIAAGAGVTIESSSGVLTSPGQNIPMVLEKKNSTNSWYLWNGVATVTASNGLSMTNGNIEWGGPMTSNITLSGTPNVGIGISPTSRITIAAGTGTANTAPLQFTSGTLEVTPRAGVMEFLTDDLYFTITTGATRKGIIMNNGTTLTSGRVPFSTTNGRLTDQTGFTFASSTLTVPAFTNSALTSGRVVFSSTAGLETDDADLTFTGGNTLTTTKIAVSTGVTNSTGLQHERITTGSISAGATALITITWDVAFADTNYTGFASVEDPTTSSLSLSVVHIESKSTTTMTVRVINNAVGSLTGTLNAMAIHD